MDSLLRYWLKIANFAFTVYQLKIFLTGLEKSSLTGGCNDKTVSLKMSLIMHKFIVTPSPYLHAQRLIGKLEST